MLSEVPPHEQTGSAVKLEDDASGEVQIKGLTIKQCKNAEDALNALFQGIQQRATGSNSVNMNSSRSHAIFTIHIESRSTVDKQEKVIFSKLHLVDLSGSERIKKTGAEGYLMKEAAYINKSLSFLEQVVVSACDKKRDHVPYRQCRLTNLLKNAIGGNCKTILCANIWPEASHIEETISTLRFASRMRQVENLPVVNEQMDQQLLIKKMEREIRHLKQELAMHDVLSKKGAGMGEPFTAEK